MGIGGKAIRVVALALGVGTFGIQGAEDGLPDVSSASGAVKLPVGVYNYAGVAQETLARAEEDASRILVKAGIEIQWVECRLPGRGVEGGVSCDWVRGAGGLLLKIIPEEMAKGFQLPMTKFGVTFQPYGAYVFADRVRTMAVNRSLPEYVVLGPVIAHELGHVLLGAGGHCAVGLMSEDVRYQTFHLAARGVMPQFTREQVQKIRARLSARTNTTK